MNSLTKVKLHGCLGDQFGEDWDLEIKSAAEALRAIDANCDGRFYRSLMENDKSGIKYKIIINSMEFRNETYEKSQDLRDLKETELFINKRIETLDIVPCIEGAGGSYGLIFSGLGIMALGSYMESPMMMLMGLGLTFQGVSNLMATPPKYEEFREIQQANKRQSYLFSGPVNSVSEGGPIPLGYGRLIIGSQLVSYNLEIFDKEY